MSLTADTGVAAGRRTAWRGRERRAVSRLAVSLRRVTIESWDREVEAFDDVVQEQLYAYAHTRWPSAVPEGLLFALGDEIIGGTLVMIQKLPLHVGAIAVCKWGPMFRDAGRPDADLLYNAMIDALHAEYAVARGMMLSVLPRAVPAPRNRQYDLLAARGFRQGAVLRFPKRYIVDVRLDDAMQKQSLGQKWRYHLNKSLKAGLSFEVAGAARLGEFDALYRAMTDRKQFPDHSAYETLPALFELEVPALRPELFFVRHAGEVVAGAVIFKAGDTGVYLFGATDDRALPLRAGYFLHWEIIRWLRDNTRARWYDLGGSDGFLGLHQFKKGMVGSAGVISDVPPVANRAAGPLPMLLGTAAFAGRELGHQLKRHADALFTSKARPDLPRSRAEGD